LVRIGKSALTAFAADRVPVRSAAAWVDVLIAASRWFHVHRLERTPTGRTAGRA